MKKSFRVLLASVLMFAMVLPAIAGNNDPDPGKKGKKKLATVFYYWDNSAGEWFEGNNPTSPCNGGTNKCSSEFQAGAGSPASWNEWDTEVLPAIDTYLANPTTGTYERDAVTGELFYVPNGPGTTPRTATGIKLFFRTTP